MRLESRHSDPIQLFEDIAHQLFACVIDPAEVGETLREKVSVEGESMEHLLREWVAVLGELLNTQKMVFGRFRITRLDMPPKGAYLLHAEAVGELIDPQRHVFKTKTLQITPTDIQLRKDPAGYHAELTLQA